MPPLRTATGIAFIILGALWLVSLGMLVERHTRAERRAVPGLPALERRMAHRATFGIVLLGLGALLIAG